MIHDRLMWHLENWVDYQKAYSPHLNGKISSIYTGSGDHFEDLCIKCDKQCARTMGAIIDSLKKPQKDAIEFAWLGAGQNWATHAMDLEDAYLKIGVMADRRGLV